MALGSTQPLTEMSTRRISRGKGGRYVRLTTYHHPCAVVTKSVNLNFLEQSGPLRACNGTALHIYLPVILFSSPLWFIYKQAQSARTSKILSGSQANKPISDPLITQKSYRLNQIARRVQKYVGSFIKPLTPNDRYSGRTAPLTSKRCILYIYSTTIVTEYFKHGIYSSFSLSL